MRRIAIAFLMTVLWFGASPTQADLTFNDGGTHDVDYSVPANLRANDGPGGTKTTVNLLAGAAIELIVAARDHSLINMYDGSVGTLLRARDYSTVIMNDGSVGGYAEAAEYGSLSIYGGVIQGGIQNTSLNNHGTVNIYGGSIGVGPVDSRARYTSTINMYGGSMPRNFYAYNNSTVNIYGGSIGHEMLAYDSSTVNIYGTAFNYAYGSIGDLSGILTGTLATGDPINLIFWRAGLGATINLIEQAPVVPVPGAVLLGAIGLSFAGWRLKRRTGEN
jgi:hypothetical protein